MKKIICFIFLSLLCFTTAISIPSISASADDSPEYSADYIFVYNNVNLFFETPSGVTGLYIEYECFGALAKLRVKSSDFEVFSCFDDVVSGTIYVPVSNWNAVTVDFYNSEGLKITEGYTALFRVYGTTGAQFVGNGIEPTPRCDDSGVFDYDLNFVLVDGFSFSAYTVPFGVSAIYINFHCQTYGLNFLVNGVSAFIVRDAVGVAHGTKRLDVVEGDNIAVEWTDVVGGVSFFCKAVIIGYENIPVEPEEPEEPVIEYLADYTVRLDKLGCDFEVPEGVTGLFFFYEYYGSGFTFFKGDSENAVGVAYVSYSENFSSGVVYIPVAAGEIIYTHLLEPFSEFSCLVKIVGTVGAEVIGSGLEPVVEEPPLEPLYPLSFVLADESGTYDFVVPAGVTHLYVSTDFLNCGLLLSRNGQPLIAIGYASYNYSDVKKFAVVSGDIITALADMSHYESGLFSFFCEIVGYDGEEIIEVEEPVTPNYLDESYIFVDCGEVASVPLVIPQGLSKVYFVVSGDGDIVLEVVKNGTQVFRREFIGDDLVFYFEQLVSAGDIITINVIEGDNLSVLCQVEKPVEVDSPGGIVPEEPIEPEEPSEPSTSFLDDISDFFGEVGSFFSNAFSSPAGTFGLSGALVLVVLVVLFLSLIKRR